MTDSTIKATCSCCRRKKSILDLVTVSKRRSGSYNRASSKVRGMVCRDCTNQAVEGKRAIRYSDGFVRNINLDDGDIRWSTACDQFGIDYSDLPRTYNDAQNNPLKFQTALEVK